MSSFRAGFRFLSISVLLLCVSMPVFAAEPSTDVLEEVVVTATKTPVPVSQLTSAVEVIKGEELEQKKIRTVIEALRLAQGVTVTQTGGPGTLAAVGIRGASNAQTLVVMDGVILNSPTAGLFDFGNLTTDNIERIEILRGAQSMLWGSDAMGGVINIITKKGAGMPTASTFVEYGSFVTLREGAQVSGTKGPLDLSASVTQWDANGFSAVNYKRGATERDGLHNFQASARAGLALPGDGRLDANVRWWKSRFDIDSAFGSTALDVVGSKTLDHRFMVSGSYDQPITSWWSHKLTLARDRQFTFNLTGGIQRNLATNVVSAPFGAGGNTNLETLNHRVESQHTFQIAKPLLLTAGYQFREGVGDSPSFSATSRSKVISSHAGFADIHATILDRILFTGGVRNDSYNVVGSATTYRVTGGYLLKEAGTKFRGSYATGFRAPTINDLFHPDGSNPNLKPEKSRSMDIGVDQKFHEDKLLLSGGYFWNRFQELIQLDAAFIPQNVGNALTHGWELGMQYRVLQNLDLRGQYTYTLTRNLDNGNRLARRPVDQASIGLSYQPISQLRVSLDYRFVGGRVNDAANAQRMLSYDVVNVSATYDVTKQWQVFGRIENLFDKDYEEVLFFGTPSRSVFAGVKFTY
ncbi:MAG: TonB-dependent receptor [Nitrospirales bacterium]|nr:TonB-dependent receptor [Nitrospirales bacterium]